MFEKFGANPSETKFFNTSNPEAYPGTGYIFKGINPDKALGLANKKDKAKVANYKTNFIDRVNKIYIKDTPHKYDGALENAENSTFYFSRGFIAITPPKDKIGFTIPKQAYPDALEQNKDYSLGSDFSKKLLERNSIENREHYSLILLNDHYGRHEKPNNKFTERAFLVPSQVLEELINPYEHKTEEQADLSSANLFFNKFQQKAKEKGLVVLDLTSASLFGSMSNAFPQGFEPYHSWEKNVPLESRDKSNLAHTHKSHAYGGYIMEANHFKDFYPSMQEADQLVAHIAKSTNAIYDVFKIARANYSKGILHNKVSPMLLEAEAIHNNLTGKDKSDFPLLCLSDYKDGFNLNNLPKTDLYLDTFDMTVRRKVLGEDHIIASKEQDGNSFPKRFDEIFIKKNLFDSNDANSKFYINEHLLFYPRHLIEKYSQNKIK